MFNKQFYLFVPMPHFAKHITSIILCQEMAFLIQIGLD